MTSQDNRALPFVPFALLSLLHLAFLAISAHFLAAASKTVLMISLLVALLFAVPRPLAKTTALPALAIALCGIGDIVIGTGQGLAFLVGLGFFLVAQVAYTVAFIRLLKQRRMPRLAILLLVWWAAFVVILAPHAGSLLLPIAIYGATLGTMTASALACNRWIATGAVLFLVSDSLLGLHRFLPGFAPWQIDVLIMLPYLFGQGLIAWGVVVQTRSDAARAGTSEIRVAH